METDVRRCSDGRWVIFHDPIRRCAPGVPTVEQALAWFRRHRTPVYLDVKERAWESELFQVIRGSGWLHRSILFAGSVPSLRRWRLLLPPRHPLYWVTGFRDSITPHRISIARRLQLQGIAAYHRRVTASSAQQIHQAGLQLFVWTARTAAEIQRAGRLGADGILSEVWPPPLRLT